MTACSLRARLHLDVSSSLALSLPQSSLCILWARQLPPQREPRRLRRKPRNCKSANERLFSSSVLCRREAAALESQTPQREPRALPRQRTDSPSCATPNSSFTRIFPHSPRSYSAAHSATSAFAKSSAEYFASSRVLPVAPISISSSPGDKSMLYLR